MVSSQRHVNGLLPGSIQYRQCFRSGFSLSSRGFAAYGIYSKVWELYIVYLHLRWFSSLMVTLHWLALGVGLSLHLSKIPQWWNCTNIILGSCRGVYIYHRINGNGFCSHNIMWLAYIMWQDSARCNYHTYALCITLIATLVNCNVSKSTHLMLGEGTT